MLTKQQTEAIIQLGKEYECNRPYMTMGEARAEMAEVLGKERWTQLSAEQRTACERVFDEGRLLEARHHRL